MQTLCFLSKSGGKSRFFVLITYPLSGVKREVDIEGGASAVYEDLKYHSVLGGYRFACFDDEVGASLTAGMGIKGFGHKCGLALCGEAFG